MIGLDPHPETFLGYGNPWERLADVLAHYPGSRFLNVGRWHLRDGLTPTERKRKERAAMDAETRRAMNRKHQQARRARLRAAKESA